MLRQLDGDFVNMQWSQDSHARKNESLREARKQEVKGFLRERRIGKKVNILAFKMEEYRQKEQESNARRNLRRLKLQ